MMQSIQVLDQITIDKIAAGEVIERPSSIVKELVENSIDAGADTVTVEITDGGISFIRVTDNGSGIPADQVRTAFLRHSTSKIRSAEDIQNLGTLGFRGEALSSIAAVTQLELLTKTADEAAGIRYEIAGGKETAFEDAASSDGTTFLIRQLFYNTPARRKFLKTSITEASHVQELMIRLAMSHPEVSFQFINQGQVKIHTSGNGRLKDVIYHIYGRDVTKELIPVDAVSEDGSVRITGFAARPTVSRGNRNFENYYVNGRYMKNKIIAKGIEDAFKGYTMQHKYPFVVLNFQVDGSKVDVNVHPQKMEVRFSNQQYLYDFIFRTLRECLAHKELIPEVAAPSAPPVDTRSRVEKEENMSSRRLYEEIRPAISGVRDTKGSYTPVVPPKTDHSASFSAGTKNVTSEQRKKDYFMEEMRKRVASYHAQNSHAEVYEKDAVTPKETAMQRFKENIRQPQKNVMQPEAEAAQQQISSSQQEPEPVGEQMNLFREKFISSEARQHFHMIGQLFETYWLIEYEEQLYIIDQHAAHEKVLYERKMAAMKERSVSSQYLSPPVILNPTLQEASVIREYQEYFQKNGFEIEPFGSDSFAVRAVPSDLSDIATEELLVEILNDLTDDVKSALKPELILDKIASRSCKAAVKGNSRLSEKEAEHLISELLGLENPYHCPHGRPTIIRMSKRELEKKFKRIV